MNTIAAGIVLLLLGLVEMAFGIYIFYALLPLWYGIFGMYVGFGLGQALFGTYTGFANGMTWLLAILFGGSLAFAAFRLEPYRRVLLGILIGMTFAFLIATAFALGGGLTFALVILGALLFGVLVQVAFDPIVIIGSSFAGAAFVLDGLYVLTLWPMFNRSATSVIPTILWLAFGLLGAMWQTGPIRNMAQPQNQPQNPPVAQPKSQQISPI